MSIDQEVGFKNRIHFNDQFFAWKRVVEVASAVLSLQDDALSLETAAGYNLARHFTVPELAERYDVLYARDGEKTSPAPRHIKDLARMGMVEMIHPGPEPPATYQIIPSPIWGVVQAYDTAVAEMFPRTTK